ncbi:peptidyl-prolyl cis-trans isomerase C-like [Oratosquilla oratoria]|uniref:peptidyl-prolyl cis-trans isomerase C-like n=1 Tax=Oratosquilla oratoria TaxID=337810 RepID=UPI003F75AB71
MSQASARHILVDSEEKCLDLLKQINDGGDFAKLAAEHSSCPSGQSGGELGTFGPGQMVPEFDRVVFSAEVGTVQGPVKTQFGYHLLESHQPRRAKHCNGFCPPHFGRQRSEMPRPDDP